MARTGDSPLDRALRKAYWRLIPLLFLSYVIAYIDRVNVAYAKFAMINELPGFNNEVIGIGGGVFFLGYFLLEIPGSIIVEKWSARRWVSRIMITWGVFAALTALVRTPTQFYGFRFLLGLAEAGFFPGVIVILTRWFPSRDRARAIAYFMMATPVAQVVSPKVSNFLLGIGATEVVNGVTVHHPAVLGLHGWQWVYIVWGVPAVLLGVAVLLLLPDWPRDARWLSTDERQALEGELTREREARRGEEKVSLGAALRNPTVLLLALAYFCGVSANYGMEFFMPSMLERWYGLKMDTLTTLAVLPPIGGLLGQILVSWSSDRRKERRMHTAVPLLIGAVALAATPLMLGALPLTIALIVVTRTCIKAYQPSFWCLPSLFLSSTAAAGCIGLINSIGNLGGFLGPYAIGSLEHATGSFRNGILFLAALMLICCAIVFFLRLGGRAGPSSGPAPLTASETRGSLGSPRIAGR